MTTTVLSPESVIEIVKSIGPDDPLSIARAIEQAVLQSPEIQALRKDAQIYRALVANCHTCNSNFEKNGANEGRIKSMTISLRVGENTNPGMQESLRSLLGEFHDRCIAMEKQT